MSFFDKIKYVRHRESQGNKQNWRSIITVILLRLS